MSELDVKMIASTIVILMIAAVLWAIASGVSLLTGISIHSPLIVFIGGCVVGWCVGVMEPFRD